MESTETYKVDVGAEELELLVLGLPYGLRALLNVEETVTLGDLVRNLLDGDGGSAHGSERRSGKKAARGEELHSASCGGISLQGVGLEDEYLIAAYPAYICSSPLIPVTIQDEPKQSCTYTPLVMSLISLRLHAAAYASEEREA